MPDRSTSVVREDTAFGFWESRGLRGKAALRHCGASGLSGCGRLRPSGSQSALVPSGREWLRLLGSRLYGRSIGLRGVRVFWFRSNGSGDPSGLVSPQGCGASAAALREAAFGRHLRVSASLGFGRASSFMPCVARALYRVARWSSSPRRCVPAAAFAASATEVVRRPEASKRFVSAFRGRSSRVRASVTSAAPVLRGVQRRGEHSRRRTLGCVTTIAVIPLHSSSDLWGWSWSICSPFAGTGRFRHPASVGRRGSSPAASVPALRCRLRAVSAAGPLNVTVPRRVFGHGKVLGSTGRKRSTPKVSSEAGGVVPPARHEGVSQPSSPDGASGSLKGRAGSVCLQASGACSPSGAHDSMGVRALPDVHHLRVALLLVRVRIPRVADMGPSRLVTDLGRSSGTDNSASAGASIVDQDTYVRRSGALRICLHPHRLAGSEST